jgi:hypothetical protein
MPEKTSRSVKEELAAIASRLLEEGKVDCFLVYERGTVPLKTTPLIVRKKEDLERIWVEDHFAPNLCAYLKEVRGGWDPGERLRAAFLISLLKEDQVKREDICVVGISCPGQLDLRKVAAGMECQPEHWRRFCGKGPKSRFVEAAEKNIPLAQALLTNAGNAGSQTPIYDHLLPGEYAPLPPRRRIAMADELRQKPRRKGGASGPNSSSAASGVMPAGMSAPHVSAPVASWKRTFLLWVSPLADWETISYSISCG